MCYLLKVSGLQYFHEAYKTCRCKNTVLPQHHRNLLGVCFVKTLLMQHIKLCQEFKKFRL